MSNKRSIFGEYYTPSLNGEGVLVDGQHYVPRIANVVQAMKSDGVFIVPFSDDEVISDLNRTIENMAEDNKLLRRQFAEADSKLTAAEKTIAIIKLATS